jgi:hypothetical protein
MGLRTGSSDGADEHLFAERFDRTYQIEPDQARPDGQSSSKAERHEPGQAPRDFKAMSDEQIGQI